jgi:hypothetical protein
MTPAVLPMLPRPVEELPPAPAPLNRWQRFAKGCRSAWRRALLPWESSRPPRPEEVALAEDNIYLRDEVNRLRNDVFLLRLDLAQTQSALEAEKAHVRHLAAVHEADRARVAADRAAYAARQAESLRRLDVAGGGMPMEG